MQKVSLLCSAAIISLAATSPVRAQQVGPVAVGILHEKTNVAVAYQPRESLGQTLLTPIVVWLAASFGLPANHDHPRLERAPAARLVMLRNDGKLSQPQLDLAVIDQMTSKRRPIAAYDDTDRTIYLPVGWSGDTTHDRSVVIHAMVYHLQNLAGLKFACPQERARMAYEAQARWLGQSGQTLESEFGLDPETRLVSIECHIP